MGATDEPEVVPPLVSRTASFGAALVGLVSTVVGLVSEQPSGIWWAAGSGLVTLLFFGWQWYRRDHVRAVRAVDDLRRRQEELRHDRATLIETLERVIDHQNVLYQEALDVTVHIGPDDRSDRVVENRRTTPLPGFSYRSVRVITPYGPGDHLRELKLSARMLTADGSPGRKLQVQQFPSNRGGVRVVVFFGDVGPDPFAWQLVYYPRGLWKPLRENGIDEFAFDSRTPLRRSVTTYTELVVRFVLPPGREGEIELYAGGGQVTREPDEGDQQVFAWRAPAGPGEHSRWRVAFIDLPDAAVRAGGPDLAGHGT